ncbi:hypothetical protein C8035_v002290 [Colletotrichum spinosum]|uniref:Cellulose-binding Sde182 C-terminal domain-containing protein n=1 Tax=Colletotrichum spinosum TaxID=1347390 RepID=A0A4R8QB32_9PEZI|nr:hypothetical protein C8035_v002290 [Colletotrichum spinosum]
MKWTLTGDYEEGNHPPVVAVKGAKVVRAGAGETVEIAAEVSDPDVDVVDVEFWQYRDEGTCDGVVEVVNNETGAAVRIPADATPGRKISIIVQGTDRGEFPLTRYDRVVVEVV